MFLLVVNLLSKWPEAAIMQYATAENTVEKLLSVIANKGVPEVLISDNDPQLVSGTFNNFMVQNRMRYLKSVLSSSVK